MITLSLLVWPSFLCPSWTTSKVSGFHPDTRITDPQAVHSTTSSSISNTASQVGHIPLDMTYLCLFEVRVFASYSQHGFHSERSWCPKLSLADLAALDNPALYAVWPTEHSRARLMRPPPQPPDHRRAYAVIVDDHFRNFFRDAAESFGNLTQQT